MREYRAGEDAVCKASDMILRPEGPHSASVGRRTNWIADEPPAETTELLVDGLNLEDRRRRYGNAGRSSPDPSTTSKMLVFSYCPSTRSAREKANPVCAYIRCQ